jgi:hypothetical protein
MLDITFLFLETDSFDSDMFFAGGEKSYFFWNCGVLGLRTHECRGGNVHSIRKNGAMMPATIVATPSMMKIHLLSLVSISYILIYGRGR